MSPLAIIIIVVVVLIVLGIIIYFVSKPKPAVTTPATAYPVTIDSNSGTSNSGTGTPNSNNGTYNSGTGTPNSNTGTPSSNTGTSNSNTEPQYHLVASAGPHFNQNATFQNTCYITVEQPASATSTVPVQVAFILNPSGNGFLQSAALPTPGHKPDYSTWTATNSIIANDANGNPHTLTYTNGTLLVDGQRVAHFTYGVAGKTYSLAVAAGANNAGC